jgi:hypothetical protein
MKSTIAKRTEGYGYKYTELADINRYCEENNIRYYQEIETSEINQKDYIITYLVKDNEVERHRGCQIVEATLQGIKNPVQEYGSSLTYCRRYSLLMALGLATEDDDAQSLSINKEATIEDSKKWTFNFGKHKGKTMQEVIKEDNQYVSWYLNNKANEYDMKCYELLTGKKLPTEEETMEKIALMSKLNDLVLETNCDYEGMLKHYEVDSNNEMTIEQLKEAISNLEKRV